MRTGRAQPRAPLAAPGRARRGGALIGPRRSRRSAPLGVHGRAYLLTGRPGVGKTTCLRRALELLRMPAGGFLTEEIRERGRRVGFALLTLDGGRTTLAEESRAKGPRVGKYGVNVDAIEQLAVPAVREAIERGWIVVIDEIGKMEMVAPAFREVVEEALRRPVTVLGTILRGSHPWGDRLKAHPAVRLLEVTPANRESLPPHLAGLAAARFSI
ncbi:MAG: nucleoside-triphosphatase [Candidatus Methylomirabilia bacterium]